ncbi:hypothetical protein MTO96_026791 [Rhipicephalus appendiculatus]
MENKGPLFRDTREHTSTSTPTRLNDQDQPASNLTSPAAESAGPSTEPSPGLLHDSSPTLDSGPHNGDPFGTINTAASTFYPVGTTAETVFDNFASAVAVFDVDKDGDLDCLSTVRLDYDKDASTAIYFWILKNMNGHESLVYVQS